MSNIKRVILLGDGMPDRPIKILGDKTVLQAAKTPNMDKMAKQGTAGFCHSVPKGYEPGSDVTNMGLMGYDPAKYYTGRSPIEAAGMHIPLGENDIAYRCNLVSLAVAKEGVFMEDFSAGHITTEEAAGLMETLNQHFQKDGLEFHTGVSYRHLMVWKNGEQDAKTTPPHDITGQNIKDFLPKGTSGEKLRKIIGEAQILLKNHPVNKKREEENKPAANSIWLWGQGKAVTMPKLLDKRGITGAMITAVDLMRGLAVLADMEVVEVDGVTGFIDTNYEGKAEAAIEALKRVNFVYLHVEAPDESGHQGSLENKIKAVEDFDEKIVGPLLAEIERIGGRAMALSDHPTPVELMTHTTEPVVFAIYPPLPDGDGGFDGGFNETVIPTGQNEYHDGYKLFERFISEN